MASKVLKHVKHFGFTLVEVLVAVAIVALALIAGSRANAVLIHNAQRLHHVFLGQICADNALIAVRLSKQMPNVGVQEHTCNQNEQSYTVRIHTNATPNPSFRRVDAVVLFENQNITKVSTLVGRY